MAIIFFLTVNGQNKNNELVDAIYKKASTLSEQNKLVEARAEFEKIIQIDPYHNDALYNLAVVNIKLGETPSSIRLLLRCVKLNDKRARKLLVDKFNFSLSYADTVQNIDIITRKKYASLKRVQFSSIRDLASKIVSTTSNKREQIQILFLWVYDNMQVDSVRFFQSGNPLPNSEAFARRIGLCDEYSNIMSEFCKAANIPTYKVVGYVKYSNFHSGDKFTEANHAWNALYIESSWVLCDLFWSTVTLNTDKTSEPHFIKREETNYVLGRSSDFIKDHLPADPVFQFLDYPISIISFTKGTDGIDATIPKMKYLNYSDSLSLFSKMSEGDRLLNIARHAYDYNKDNPNDLIAESYNYAVDIINKKNSTKQELIKAKKSLTMALVIIDTSKNEDIKSLKEDCKNGLAIIGKRLNNNKPVPLK